MKSVQEFMQHLAAKKKGKKHIEERSSLIRQFHATLNGQPPTAEAIDTFVRKRWSGYVSRDKNTFQALSDYADFCEQTAHVFNKFVRDTFEGEARKAMKAYKSSMVFIPSNTKINPIYLDGLTNEEFINAFTFLQKFLYAVYDAVEQGSPFGWGWPNWSDLTWYGIIHNRVVMVLNALAECGYLENNTLVVDKYRFTEHSKKRADEQIVCRPPQKTKLLLEGLMQMGLHIEGLDDASMPHFIVSFPNHPNVITAICSYFKARSESATNHVRYFSYRFVEDAATQTHETLFLAMTDGEPKHLREIYYWLYDEAVKHGFEPTGSEKMHCYLYKKGTKEWLLLGKGSSYHESEFLHSINYSIATKFGFPKTYYTHPEKIEWLRQRFPTAFTSPWGGCHGCKAAPEDCKHYVTFGHERYVCIKGYYYFHDPTFDDVKEMLELYKIEKNIKPL